MTDKPIYVGRNIFLCLLVCQFAGACYAQDALTNKLAYIAVNMDRPAIKVGEKVPDITIEKIYQFSPRTIQLSALKGKLVILDFWHQWCTSCLENFPRLQALQKQYKDQLVILPVTFQSEASVASFFQRRKSIGLGTDLPSVVEDTILRKWFPHSGDPHEVWINKDGVVEAITEAHAVTSENIERLLSGNKLDVEEKRYSYAFDQSQSFLVNGNGGPDSAFSYRSLITPYIDSIGSNNLVKQHRVSRTRLFMSNATVLDMYLAAYANLPGNPIAGLQFDFLYKRVIDETTDSLKNFIAQRINALDYQSYLDFKRRHLFCYELTLPGSIALSKSYAMMIQDLDRFFGISSFIEKKQTLCLNLIRTESLDKIETSGDRQESVMSENNLHLRLVNRPLSDLTDVLNTRFDLPPVFDKTGCKKFVTIQLDFEKLPDLRAFNDQLTKYGLRLAITKQTVNMLVLKNTKRVQSNHED